MTDNEQLRSEFDRIGEAAVQLKLDNGLYNEHVKTIAIEWLAQRMEKSVRRKDDSQAEQIDIARSAKDAAWAAARAAERANIRATIALIMAAISMIISIFGLLQKK